MDDAEKRAIVRAAVARYGARVQKDRLQEECCELAVALAHERRAGEVPLGTAQYLALDAVLEEAADVEITLMSLREIVGASFVDMWVERKLTRLKQRMAEGK